MTAFRPLNSFIQIQPFAAETVHRGIILAPAAQTQPTRGKVVAIGPGKVNGVGRSPMPDISVGDTIAFTPGSLQQVKSTEGNVFLVEAEAILGVEA